MLSPSPVLGSMAPGGAPSPRALRWLLAVCAILVAHGSLFPYEFATPASLRDALADLVSRRGWWTSRGDVLGNVLLFVPLGALGHWVSRAWLDTAKAAALAVSAGSVFGLLLQVGQVFVPSRDAELSDVLWNAVGLLAGAAVAAATPAPRAAGLGAHVQPVGPDAVRLRLAASLAVLWLSLHWWPFVATLDARHVVMVLRALWRDSAASPLAVAGGVLGVVVLGHLLRPAPQRALLLMLGVALAFAGRLFGLGLMPPGTVTGLAVGLGVAALSWRLPDRTVTAVVLWAVVGWFLADALRPYRLMPHARPFHWLPFEAMLNGSMMGNLLALCWNLFWLGSAVVLATLRWPGASGRSALFIMAGVAAIEGLQTRLPGRTPDITPALLPLLWWLVVRASLSARASGPR